GNQDVGGAYELHIQAGIEHVRRRHSGVQEASFRPNDFGKMREESDDIVLDLRFDGINAGDIELCAFAFVPDFFGSIFWDDTEIGYGLGGMCLDLEPDAEFGFRRPDRGHLGAGIARDRHAASPRALAAALRIAAILPL